MLKKKKIVNDSRCRKRRLTLSCSKTLSALLHGITSKHKGDWYCLKCLHSFRTENKFKFHKKVCQSKDFWGIVIPSENDNIY